jgi:xanthine dehydrogenase iron-sulfur cluster and FAD-binding subunit A/CO/xanthine dehydrogenase Mo-binding subunit
VSSITFLLNGKSVSIYNPDPEQTLLTYLRNYTPYTATKQGCQQGGCGICTVMLSYQDFDGTLVNVSVNGCLLKLVNCNGLAITTNEGLGNIEKPHTLQTMFSKVGAFQCGYCTSGHIMNIYAAFQTQNNQSNNGLAPSFDNAEKNLDGNLCRCTSSRPIIEAYKTAMISSSGASTNPYVNQSNSSQILEYNTLKTRWISPTGDNVTLRTCPIYNPLTDTKNAYNYQSIAPISFPTVPVAFVSKLGYTQVNAVSEYDVTQTIARVGTTNTMIVNGETSFGIPGYEKPSNISTVINIQNIPSLYTVSTGTNTMTFGAGVKIQKLYQLLKNSGNSNFGRIADHVYKISGHQVRNLGSWFGGIMMAKKGVNGGSLLGQPKYFYSDMALIMQVAGLTLNFTVYNGLTSNSYTNVSLQTFMQTTYTGLIFVKNATLTIPTTSTFRSYRIAERQYNAHAQAHMAIMISQTAGPSAAIDAATVIVGALGEDLTGEYSSYVRFTALETYLVGKTLSSLVLNTMNGLVSTLLTGLTEPFANAQFTLADRVTYKGELVKGFITKWLSDMNGSSYTLSYNKDTSFGSYLFVSPTGVIQDSLATNLYPSVANISSYQPLELSKASGQAKYNSDTQSNGQFYVSIIYGGRHDAKWFNWTFTGSNIKSWDAIPVQKIDYSSTTTTSVINAAKATNGVKLVITRLDYEPNYVKSANFLESANPIFSLFANVYSGFSLGFNPGNYTSIFGTDEVRNSFTLSDYLLYVGQPIGFVVAETPELAKIVAKSISNGIAYVNPATLSLPEVQPRVLVDWKNLSNNKLFDRYNLDWGGNTNGLHNLVGNYAGNTGSKPEAAIIARQSSSTGIGYFDIGYATSQYQMSGSYFMGNVDHFPMNRVTVSTKIDNNGRKTLIADTQNPGALLQYMIEKYINGQHLFPDGRYYYSLTGPARNTDGTLVFNPTEWDVQCGFVGGHFGQKYGLFPLQHAAMLATNLLKAPVHGESDWVEEIGDCGGNTDTAVQYKLGFDSKGKVTALYNAQYYDVGAAVTDKNFISVVNEGSAECVNQVFNWGSFEQIANMVFTNKPSSQALRAVHWYDGNHMNTKYLDLVANALKVNFGSTGASQFDIQVRNLITKESPFVCAAGAGQYLPMDNLGLSQISPLSIIDGISATQTAGWQSGIYVDPTAGPGIPMYTHTEILQAIDRKVNNTYFTTGALSIFYPNGYTGSALASPSYSAAYDDTTARYPAIKALEGLVNTYNARSENRFNKLGLSVTNGQYMTTSGYSVNQTIKITMTRDGTVKVGLAGTDGGSHNYDKVRQTVASILYCPLENVVIEIDNNNVSTAGFTHGGSVISAQMMRAAKIASTNFLNQCLDYIFRDINTYLSQNYVDMQLTNVFAPTGTYNIPAFTGAYPGGSVYTTVNNLSEVTNQVGGTGAYALVILSTGTGYQNGWDGTLYQYMGTGAGNVGPVSNPTGYINAGLAFQSTPAYVPGNAVYPDRDNYSSYPTSVDVNWCKSNPDLARLTLIRYAQQKTANNAGTGPFQGPALSWETWSSYTEQQKQNLMNTWWRKAMNGLLAGAPSVDLPFGVPNYIGEQRTQIEGIGWFFSSPTRTNSSEGQAWESTVSPWVWLDSFGGPFAGLAGFQQFYYIRVFTAALSLVQLNCLTGEVNELHAIPVIDLGRTINPLYDCSQLEGGYLMGKSAGLLETKLWHQTGGANINYGTWEYKPNCSANTPAKIETVILNNPPSIPNAAAFPNQYLAVGEIGMCCAQAPVSAVRQAIQAYRSQPIFGAGGNQPLDTTIDSVQNWMDNVAQLPMINMRIKNATPLPTNFTI